MAKRAKRDDGEGVKALRGAGYDSDMVRSYVERIETLQEEIDEKMQAAKDECQPLREDIGGVKTEAHEAGIPRKELNAKLQERRLRRKADAVRGMLTDEQAENFDQLSKALGDFDSTELGKAAARRAAATEDRATAH